MTDGSAMRRVAVTAGQPYEVVIGHGALAEVTSLTAGVRTAVILHQPAAATTAAAARLVELLATTGTTAHCLPIADAEEGKTVAQAAALWSRFAELGITRKDIVIGVGGGAATDLAGYIAASWMRGIRVIQVPTTLLGMVDAAVGGKTGINIPEGKNLVGAFHEPTGVLIDLDFLATLPAAEIIAGSAEIIKTGFIADQEILHAYTTDPQAAVDPSSPVLADLIYRSVAVKAAVVSADLQESNLREILNYGHTLGHAVERRENYRWRHGHAVAVGLVYAAELARLTGHLTDEEAALHTAILSAVGLPTRYDAAAYPQLREYMAGDKKNKDGALRFVILDGLGTPIRLEAPDEDLLVRAYAALCAD